VTLFRPDDVPEPPGQSRALIATLLRDDPVAAEAAAARLSILGRPSVRNLLLALPAATTLQAVRVLGVLERLGDPLALTALVDAAADSRSEVAEAGIAALAVLLTAPRSAVAATALDHITAAALDSTRGRRVRLAALRALIALDLDVVAPLRAQLLADPDDEVRAAAESAPSIAPERAARPAAPADASPADLVLAAATGTFPADPEVLRQALARVGDDIAAVDLHRVVQALREMERLSPAGEAWRAARAAAHQALAVRGSRLAVYDLRETVQALGAATPVGVLSALQAVGDAASLDAVAEAWVVSDDHWFRSQLAATFAVIVRREGLTRRHGAVRKLTQRAPDAVDALWPKRQ
jgi:hypothetical protein